MISLNFQLKTKRYVPKAFLSPFVEVWSWLKVWLAGMPYRPTLSPSCSNDIHPQMEVIREFACNIQRDSRNYFQFPARKNHAQWRNCQ